MLVQNQAYQRLLFGQVHPADVTSIGQAKKAWKKHALDTPRYFRDQPTIPHCFTTDSILPPPTHTSTITRATVHDRLISCIPKDLLEHIVRQDGASIQNARNSVQDFKSYFAAVADMIIRDGKKTHLDPGESADIGWHRFIMADPMAYRNAVQEACGQMIHHEPTLNISNDFDS